MNQILYDFVCYNVSVSRWPDGQKLELLKLTPAKQSANFDLLANVSEPDLNWCWLRCMIETLKVQENPTQELCVICQIWRNKYWFEETELLLEDHMCCTFICKLLRKLKSHKRLLRLEQNWSEGNIWCKYYGLLRQRNL